MHGLCVRLFVGGVSMAGVSASVWESVCVGALCGTVSKGAVCVKGMMSVGGGVCVYRGWLCWGCGAGICEAGVFVGIVSICGAVCIGDVHLQGGLCVGLCAWEGVSMCEWGAL